MTEISKAEYFMDSKREIKQNNTEDKMWQWKIERKERRDRWKGSKKSGKE